MNEKAEEAIRKKIIGTVSNAEICFGLIGFNGDEHIDSLVTEILKVEEIKEYIDSLDVINIVYHHISDYIEKKELGKTRKAQFNHTEQIEIADLIIQFLKRIPIEYNIYIPLPNIKLNIPDEIRLNDFISIRYINNDEPLWYKNLMAFLNKNDIANDIATENIQINKFFLKVQLKGFCRMNFETKTIKKSLYYFKIIFQQASVHRFFDYFPYHFKNINIVANYLITKCYIACEDISDGINSHTFIELPLTLSKFLNEIYLDDDFEKALDSSLINSKDITKRIEHNFNKAIHILSFKSDSHANKIISTIQWYVDSYIYDNDILSFLQVCIGFESLYGKDKEISSITDTISDRCSYVVCDRISERDKIRDKFKAFYKVRSKIVHGSKIDLEQNDYKLLDWGREILIKSINKEIEKL